MANKIDRNKMESDLFLEMLEVYINSILYLREIYPSAIFRKRRIYSTTTFISILPTLNKYMENVLKTAQDLKSIDKLFQVELIIYQRECELFGTPDDEVILEKYIFHVEQSEDAHIHKEDLETYVLKFEEDLRRGLIELNQKVKYLQKLNTEFCKFRIHLETTENAYVELVNKDNSKSSCYPWTLTHEKEHTRLMQTWQMVPVVQVNPFTLSILTTQRRNQRD